MTTRPTGVFISLDGLDGTGKSTQCRLLVDWLRGCGLPVTPAVDPGGTAFGAKVRELLLHGRDEPFGPRAEAMLFMASRAELVDRVIRPALDRGEIVVSDRFLLANVVYQGHAGGLPVDDLWAVGEFVTGGIEPDLTLVFDLPVDQVVSRLTGPADRIESRGDDYRGRVRAGFLTEAGRRPDRIIVVDASPPVGEVHQTVRAIVASHMIRRGFEIPGDSATKDQGPRTKDSSE